ncbi:MAG: TRAP transporter large permease subunit, partial [Rhodospirillales bacterium]
MISAILFGVLCLLMALGVPVAIAMGLSSIAAVTAQGLPLVAISQRIFAGIDSFPLLAVPFFLLAAELMTGGALAQVLVRFAAQFVGHLRGGLGHTNIVTLTFFSGISGSAIDGAAGPGSRRVREMSKRGSAAEYSTARPAAPAIGG